MCARKARVAKGRRKKHIRQQPGRAKPVITDLGAMPDSAKLRRAVQLFHDYEAAAHNWVTEAALTSNRLRAYSLSVQAAPEHPARKLRSHWMMDLSVQWQHGTLQHAMTIHHE